MSARPVVKRDDRLILLARLYPIPADRWAATAVRLGVDEVTFRHEYGLVSSALFRDSRASAPMVEEPYEATLLTSVAAS